MGFWLFPLRRKAATSLLGAREASRMSVGGRTRWSEQISSKKKVDRKKFRPKHIFSKTYFFENFENLEKFAIFKILVFQKF